MYSWVTQELWFVLSILGLIVFFKKFNYNESVFSEYNKLLTLFIPVFVLMLIGSSMALVGSEKTYIKLHNNICLYYGIVVIGFVMYWGWKAGGMSKTTKVCLVIAGVCIMMLVLLDNGFF